MANMSVNIAGVAFKNPVIAASGCFGFGLEYEDFYPVETFGGVSLKGMTLDERLGNPPPRIAESKCGILNSVGLQNPGVQAFIAEELPKLRGRDVVKIANVAGSTVEDYCEAVERLCQTEIDIIELNISCPNVKKGGAAFGVSCESASGITKAVRKVCTKPLMVKLSPNVTDIASIAQAVENEGADAVSLINTLLGMRIDIRTRRPILKNNVGGMSGGGVFPLAVRMVWQVKNAVKIPVVGLGGIQTADDAIEMMLAGASAIQIGTVMMEDPMAPVKIVQGMQEYLTKYHINDINEIVGQVQPW